MQYEIYIAPFLNKPSRGKNAMVLRVGFLRINVSVDDHKPLFILIKSNRNFDQNILATTGTFQLTQAKFQTLSNRSSLILRHLSFAVNCVLLLTVRLTPDCYWLL